MKKRMLIILLSTLLVATASACHDVSDHTTSKQEDTQTAATTEQSCTLTEADADLNTPTIDQVVAKGSIHSNGNDSNRTTYKISQDGKISLLIEDWNKDHLVSAISLSSDTEIEIFQHIRKAIAINNKCACLFLKQSEQKINVIRLKNGTLGETVTSLDVNENVIAIKGNFINENIGYFFAFQEVSDGHARGSSKLSNLYITKDGGNTWDLIDIQNAPSIDLQESIMFAKMISDEVGLISGNVFGYGYNFCERTLLTIDGGLNWFNVADLPEINDLAWAVVTDFVQGRQLLRSNRTLHS